MTTVLVCGTRGASSDGDYWLLEQTLGELMPISRIIHGGCPDSPDELAGRYCHEREIDESVFPAQWGKHGKRAGFIRNEEMAEEGPDWCVALWDGRSNGTKDMISRAVQHGTETIIVPVSTK